MTDEQIEEKLKEIEKKTPELFKQHELKEHIFWKPVADTDKLTWGVYSHFAGNLPSSVKIEVSRVMSKLTKGDYQWVKKEN